MAVFALKRVLRPNTGENPRFKLTAICQLGGIGLISNKNRAIAEYDYGLWDMT
jgi:hypothetical protein